MHGHSLVGECFQVQLNGMFPRSKLTKDELGVDACNCIIDQNYFLKCHLLCLASFFDGNNIVNCF